MTEVDKIIALIEKSISHSLSDNDVAELRRVLLVSGHRLRPLRRLPAGVLPRPPPLLRRTALPDPDRHPPAEKPG
jgi:hypothetical protein